MRKKWSGRAKRRVRSGAFADAANTASGIRFLAGKQSPVAEFSAILVALFC
ncbi:hypothetical protein P4479_13265 [Brevibacillus agri]|uniref:hypothetical protein n=1 Tax=Brevibacillus agri TaxID=51101 RepID=UPI002E242800|nr:hypothetical protein [Brevibacillus agri]